MGEKGDGTECLVDLFDPFIHAPRFDEKGNVIEKIPLMSQEMDTYSVVQPCANYFIKCAKLSILH